MTPPVRTFESSTKAHASDTVPGYAAPNIPVRTGMNALIDGLSLSFQIHGEGEPVLFIHGFPLSGELWMPTVQRLGGAYRSIVPDLRGHGASESSPEASMARYATDLALLLDHTGEIGPVTLVGLSMGGYIALEFCRRYPERVRALVLVDTRAGPDSEDAARGRYESAERALREGSGPIADRMVEKLFGPEASADLREEWRSIMSSTPPEGVAAALRAMAVRSDSFATLRTFEKPLLIVVGKDDVLTPPSEAQRMHEAVPGSRLEIVAGAGHMTPVEQPDHFAAVLRDFLAGLPDPGT